MIKKLILSTLILTTLILRLALTHVHGAEYNANYTVEYYPNQDTDKPTVVKYSIVINDLPKNVYLQQYQVLFPKHLNPKNISARATQRKLRIRQKQIAEGLLVTIYFPSPQANAGNVIDRFELECQQQNILQTKGGATEITIPTIENVKNNQYSVVLHIPQNLNPNVSVVKPEPSRIDGFTLYWDNVNSRNIYLILGSERNFRLNLTYNLKNEKAYPIKTEIALPPETSYQQITVESIKPEADNVYLDEDGNYMLQYKLLPNEDKKINFIGFATVLSKPQESMLPYIKDTLNKNKKNYLAENKYWSVPNQTIKKGSTPEEIYNFVIETLEYDYDGYDSILQRKGATEAIVNPDLSVCSEYADLFIALARQNQYQAKLLSGFAYTDDPILKPAKVDSDILHAWPAIWDKQNKSWKYIDPTWQDTSGIDYFNSFDLNHIVFSINASDPVYPYPAGMYKIVDSRDVLVEPYESKINKKRAFQVQINFPRILTNNQEKNFDITVTNTGNVFLKNEKLKVKGVNVKVMDADISIPLLAPHQTQTFKIPYTTDKTGSSPRIQVFSGSKLKAQYQIDFFDNLDLKIPLGIAIGLIFVLLFFIRLKK